MPVAEGRQLLAGLRPASGTVELHPDYPMSETLDALAMLTDAYEVMGRKRPDDPRWWIHQIVVAETVVGDIGFHGPPGPDPPLTVEIGYAVVPPWRGRGVATRACRLILARAWADGADRVVAETDPANLASQRVLGAAGFRAGIDGAYVINRTPDPGKIAGRLPSIGEPARNLPAIFEET